MIPIPGFPSYMIEEDGTVFSIKANKVLATFVSTRGYLTVKLYRNRERKHKSIHRLVAEAFIPNPSGLPEVNHIDGNKKNNSVSNLEWSTKKDNWDHAIRNGLNNPVKTSEIQSSFTGVSWDKTRNKWQAKVKVENKTKKLGRFREERDAAQVYNFFLYINRMDRPYNTI